MKLLRNYRLGVLALLTIVMFSACGDLPIEHGTQYVLSGPDDADTADMRATQLVIENRLNNFGLNGDFEISTQGNKITIRVREGAVKDSVRLRNLLQSSGGLKFRATYFMWEIGKELDSAQKTFLRINHIDSANASAAGLAAYFVPGTYQNASTPLIAYCRPEDTAAVSAILHTDSIASIFPADLVFRWGKGDYLENAGPTIALFACKEGYNYVMNGNDIVSVSSQINNDMYEVSLQFGPTGAEAFNKITRANIGRSLAIELDNFIYSFPTVNQEIIGGSVVITGNFTEMEADDLTKLLNAGSLPLSFRITEQFTF